MKCLHRWVTRIKIQSLEVSGGDLLRMEISTVSRMRPSASTVSSPGFVVGFIFGKLGLKGQSNFPHLCNSKLQIFCVVWINYVVRITLVVVYHQVRSLKLFIKWKKCFFCDFSISISFLFLFYFLKDYKNQLVSNKYKKRDVPYIRYTRVDHNIAVTRQTY